jgi:acetylornithine/N-succinyldiaminopimelate aminotransferase
MEAVVESMQLMREKFLSDEKVVKAKQLIKEALAQHQESIEGVKGADSELQALYEKELETIGSLRGGKLWYPYIGSGFGRGALVELRDGSVKYDFISGIGVHYFGHNSLALLDSQIDSALSNTVMQGNLQQNHDSLELLDLLVSTSKMDHCFLTTSGAMACENGFKMLFQKHSPASRLLAFSKCFMGRSLVTSQITDKPAYRQGLPANVHVDYVPFYDYKDPEGSTKRSVAALKEHLKRYPNQYAAMSFELVQGEGGFYPGTKDFFVALMETLKEAGVSIFVDEIQTFARTSQLFAFQYFGLEEYVDLVTIGKVSQVCATLYKDHLSPKPGLLSQTFTASSSAIGASKAMIKHLLEEGFYGDEGRIQRIHDYLSSKLEAISEEDPYLIQGPFGIGSMVAFTVFEGDKDKTLKFLKNLYEMGVIAFLAGDSPARVRFLLPVPAIDVKDIDCVVKICYEALLKTKAEF